MRPQRAPVPQLLDDVAETWQRLDHTQGVEGHKRTGLSAGLSGADDWQITREARMFWDDVDMPTVRTEVLKEVREMVQGGALTWANVRSLIRHPAEKGEYGEGEEFEGELAPGEKLWEEDEGAFAAEADQQESALDALDLDEVPGDRGPRAVREEGDDEAEVAEAELALKRKEQLEQIRLTAAELRLPAVQWAMDKQLRRIEKGQVAGSSERRANAVLKREVGRQADEAKRKRAKATKKALKAKRNALKVKRLRAEAAERKRVAKAKRDLEKAELKKKLDAVPKHFTDEMCGQGLKNGGGPKELQARKDSLERLKLRAPALPPKLEATWPDVRDWYAADLAARYKEKTGVEWNKRINDRIEKLGGHIEGASGKEKTDGRANSFKEWVERLGASKPAPKSGVLI